MRCLNSLWILDPVSTFFNGFDVCFTDEKAFLDGLFVGFIYIFFTFGVTDVLLRGDNGFFTAFFPSLIAKLLTFLLFSLPKTPGRA